VLRNLLDNAIKFTAAGMVCVHVDFDEPIHAAAEGDTAGRPSLWGGIGDSGSGDGGDDEDMACPASSQLSTAQLRKLLHRHEQVKLSRTPASHLTPKKASKTPEHRHRRGDSSRVMLRITIDDTGPGLPQTAVCDPSAAEDVGGSATGAGHDDHREGGEGDSYFRSTSESGMGLGLGVVRAAVHSLGGSISFHSGNPLAPGLSVVVRVPMRVLPSPLLESLKEKLPLLIPPPPRAPAAAAGISAAPAVSADGLRHAATDIVASLTAMVGGGGEKNISGSHVGTIQNATSANGAMAGFTELRVALFLQSPALGGSLARVLTAAGARVVHCATEPEALQLVVSRRAHAVVYDAVRGDDRGDRGRGSDDDGGEGDDEFDHDDGGDGGEDIGAKIGAGMDDVRDREWRATAAAPTAFDRMLAAAMRAMPANFARHAVAIKLLPFGATLPAAAKPPSASSSYASSPLSSTFSSLPSSSSSPSAATAFSTPSVAVSSMAPLSSDDVASIVLLRKPIEFPAMLTVRARSYHAALIPVAHRVFSTSAHIEMCLS
jgi:hypothetical protein